MQVAGIKSLVLEPREPREDDNRLTRGTFVTLGGVVRRNNATVHGSNGKGQEGDELELHGAREDWDGSAGGGDASLL